MFDSILRQSSLRKTQYGLGLCIALFVHAAALLWVAWRPAQHASPTNSETEVLLYARLPPHPLPQATPPPGNEPPLSEPVQLPPPPPKTQKSPGSKAKAFIQPAAMHAAQPRGEETVATPVHKLSPTHSYSPEAGEAGEEANAPFHSALAGKSGFAGGFVAHGLDVIPFGEGMLPPQLLRNHPIRFSREALEARIEGRALVRCTITTEGNVENCRFIQSLPYMDEAILSALYLRKYSPATYQGKKISVDYNIPIRLKLP